MKDCRSLVDTISVISENNDICALSTPPLIHDFLKKILKRSFQDFNKCEDLPYIQELRMTYYTDQTTPCILPIDSATDYANKPMFKDLKLR